MDRIETDVLVVGAGPVGMTAALSLALSGRSVVVVDQLTEGQNTSRAAVVHARTLEVFQELGMAAGLMSAGIALPTVSFRTRERILMPLDFSRLRSSFPVLLFVSQAETERLLAQRLHELQVPLLRPRKVVDLRQHDDGVEVTLADGTALRARYVIGADGMHSTVRKLCSIPFRSQGRQGATDEASFVLADIVPAGPALPPEASLNVSGQGLLVFVPLPDGHRRIVAEVADAPPSPDAAYIQALLQSRGPVDQPADVAELAWSSRFRIHHSLAASFRSGRVLLAGDAAHVHSPAGGQGMNLGVRDAFAMARALDTVLQLELNQPETGGTASEPAQRSELAQRKRRVEDVLAEVAVRRRAQARKVIAITQLISLFALVPRGLRAPRNLLIRAAAKVPAVRHRIARTLAGLDDR